MIAQTIVAVHAYDRVADAVRVLTSVECGFAYRSSVFKHSDRWVVLEVDFRLAVSAESAPIRYAELARRLGVELGERAPLGDVREAVLDLRRGKGMVIDPADPDSVSAGSFSNLVDADFILDKRVVGGLQRVPITLAERLGDRVRLNTPVLRLEWSDDGGVVAHTATGSIAARRAIQWDNNLVTTLEVVSHLAPISARTWVRRDGLVLRQEVPFPFVKLILERLADRGTAPSVEDPGR